jgi:hypothetical protein
MLPQLAVASRPQPPRLSSAPRRPLPLRSAPPRPPHLRPLAPRSPAGSHGSGPAWRSASAVAAAAARSRSATCGGGEKRQTGAGERGQGRGGSGALAAYHLGGRSRHHASSGLRPLVPPSPNLALWERRAQLGGGPGDPRGPCHHLRRLSWLWLPCPCSPVALQSPCWRWLAGCSPGLGLPGGREEGGEGEVDAGDQPVGGSPAAA